MKVSAKIIKVTGVIHEVHGILMMIIYVLLLLYLIGSGGMYDLQLLLFLLLFGIPALYIYIGFQLRSLPEAKKAKNLLIASIILASCEVVMALFNDQTAGVFFIVELIMSIVAMCNLDSYGEYLRWRKRNKNARRI